MKVVTPRKVAALLVSLLLVSSCNTTDPKQVVPARRPAVVGSDQFVAVRPLPGHTGSRAVTLSDLETGQLTSVVLPQPWHGMTVNATAVDEARRIWVSLSSGPNCTSNVAGCGPQPGSCHGQIVQINPGTGKPTVVVTAPAGQLIGDAQPSPDGKLVAYLEGTCDRSYFNQHIRVRSLATGASWTIGAGLIVCHTLNSLAWTPDSTTLAVVYGASLVTGTHTEYGRGSCAETAPNELATVPALTGATGLPGRLIAVDPGCEAKAATATGTGYAAIEACSAKAGSSDYLGGPAWLLVYNATARVSRRTPIGSCLDGAELRTDTTHTSLLGSSYQFCNPPGTTDPHTVTFTASGPRLSTIINEPNGGEDSISAISG
ncbi:MAG: hypothetical protein JWN95_690 [Frankiales bacterium]|nr:hypothetical protein [Frankiales bacterium]